MSLHDGHRQRLRQRFLQEGLDHFTDIQALELALFYCIPRRDTNPIAHALLQRFGSLSRVLEAPAEDLAQVPGMGEGSAAFLHLIRELGRYYLVDRSTNILILDTVELCGEYLYPFFFGKKLETVYLLCMDAKCKVLSCREIGEGNVNSADISLRKIVHAALTANASSVVLAHNHPSGLAVPSQEDVETTYQVAEALQKVDVSLVDHIIVADDDYVSLAQSGYHWTGKGG